MYFLCIFCYNISELLHFLIESGKGTIHYMKKIIRVFTLWVLLCLACACGGNGSTEEAVLPETGQPLWTLTQYGDTTGLQASFYTLVSTAGEVIVIDGGHEENAPFVKEVLAETGNHVDAWILTHPHPDHIGAFLQVMEEGEVTVDAIYDNGMDYEVFQTLAHEWDEPQLFAGYLELTKGWQEVRSVKKGDELSFDGLNIHFFWSYEPGMEKTIGDIHNNASLVFRVVTEDRSMLFVGDCYRDVVANALLEENGEQLNSDYVQMGHHGNNTLPMSFYEKVQPTGVFFDAPEWLLTGDAYDASKNLERMQMLAEEEYDFRTAPNRVSLFEPRD